MRRHCRGVHVLLVVLLAPLTGLAQSETSGKGKEHWAKAIEKPGLPNLHQVSANLYRGAQPTSEGMKELEKMGVKTVVNLRSFHSDRDELRGTKLNYEHIRMEAWDAEEAELLRFLRIVTDPKKVPVFVHCQHGADRTGMMVAMYRVVVEKWTKEEAIDEMTEGGFGFHAIWANLVRFVRKLDVKAIEKKLERRKPVPAQ